MYRATLTPESTPQEVYNHLIAAVEADSFPSSGPDKYGTDICLYRSGDKACAMGIFIPDKKIRGKS